MIEVTPPTKKIPTHIWARFKAMFTGKPSAPEIPQHDMIAVLLLKQVLRMHLQGNIIFPSCQTLTEQRDRVLRRAAELGLDNTSIAALSDHITKLEDSQI
jgi:hypothetical protein